MHSGVVLLVLGSYIAMAGVYSRTRSEASPWGYPNAEVTVHCKDISSNQDSTRPLPGKYMALVPQAEFPADAGDAALELPCYRDQEQVFNSV
jgi:hypothetical protein